MNSERRLGGSTVRGWSGLEGFSGDLHELQDGETLEDLIERLADREELLLEGMRIAGVGGWEFDPATNRLNWSDETFHIFGLEPGSEEPTQELFYSLVLEEDRLRMLDRQTASYEEGTIFDEEYRILRPDGEIRCLNSRAQVVPRGRERRYRFLGVVRDITERRVFEQKLEEERAIARKLQADLIHISRASAMGAMASAMAHELNQPLTATMNAASALRMLVGRGAGPDELSGAIEIVQDSAHRAAEIIRRLRRMTTRGEVETVRVPLAECLSEAAALALTGSNVEIGYDVPPDLCVQADRVQLQQVLVNLVRNAVEAVEEGRTPRIEIAARPEGAGALISVRDYGAGIAEHVLPTIFDSFVSTKPQGMGVGLSISRTIVEAHGGTLTAESAPGQGATFHIALPVAAPES
jgi:two-component system sensor kinase FixL